MAVNYADTIPNNVNLSEDRRLIRALEKWRPKYLEWWHELGPAGTDAYDVYLRTAVGVDAKGWAHFDYLRMLDYRWGIFLAEPVKDRRIAFGEHRGTPVWQEVPGEYRADLRRLVVVQADTEPASVEQQRHLGLACPSLYDLRNLFQVNVEEGRHLWAMVYLLHAYFGRDGREEGEELLARHAGDARKPRILNAFNVKTTDWLSFFMFTFFQDRDGKYQLCALAESGFDPLSRTCRFMLTEEAHHMFVGESGVSRIIQRTCEVMRDHGTDDVRRYGVVDLSTIQKFINAHYSICLDLFGQELSTNAANYYSAGLKGRYQEEKIDDDHRLADGTYPVPELVHGRIETVDENALTAVNERLRNDYAVDCQRGVDRWNNVVARHGIDLRFTLPNEGFNREIGFFAGLKVSPDGRIIDDEEWNRRVGEWLPMEEDRAFVQSLMGRVVEPAKVANWIAPPARGIDNKPLDFEYVRFG